MGGCGSVWKELNTTPECSFFPNPFDLWVFANIPHLLKILRNHFLDKGILLEITLTPKVNEQLLTMKGNKRLNVAFTKTLFLKTTATAIQTLTGNTEAAAFFQLVENCFDVMNSRQTNSLP
ncbi:hypothetical protein PR048_009466, partial [Dryococelus australis]